MSCNKAGVKNSLKMSTGLLGMATVGPMGVGGMNGLIVGGESLSLQGVSTLEAMGKGGWDGLNGGRGGGKGGGADGGPVETGGGVQGR